MCAKLTPHTSRDSFIQHFKHTTAVLPLSYATILSSESSSEGQQMVTLFTELSCPLRLLDRILDSSPCGLVVCTSGPEGSCIKTRIRPAMLKGTLLPLSNLSLSSHLILRGLFIKLNFRLPPLSQLSWAIALFLPG